MIKLSRIMLGLSLVFILHGLMLAQVTDSPSGLKQKIKALKNGLQFSVRYYEFLDSTRVSVGPFNVSGTPGSISPRGTLWMTADFSFRGHNLKEHVDGINLTFDSESGGWLFLDNRDVYAMVDGERVKLGEVVRRDSHHRHYSVSERVIYKLPIDAFIKIASGKAVELQVGSVFLQLKDEHLAAFKGLLSLTTAVCR